MHQTLAWVHLSLLNYAYSYTRSQHIAHTMIVFKDGQEAARIVGAKGKSQLLDDFKPFI